MVKKTPKTKVCSKCGRRRPLAEYKPDKRYRFGVRAWCNICENAYRREFVSRNPEPSHIYHRRTNLKKNYGITLEQYEAVLKKQGGGCAICGYVPPPGRRRLAVDHCHKTKTFRGILCHMCNRGIAHFRDKPELMRQGAKYLARSLKRKVL